ncbi:MAG: sigma-70 family RNA polymerase sigma factor [Elainella sp. Prado103]|nr:sigma-70 family RNA polymerase sigma factor [Elainella sp. Prado103]
MRPRQKIIELFSTFLQFEGDFGDRWVADPQLRRQMQQLTQGQATAAEQELSSEKFWALYWYRHWSYLGQQSELPARHHTQLHLSAYLQEPCYWAAHQTVRKFSDLQYRLPDCFQIAIAEVLTVLKGFNPDRGASLKTYASMAFSSTLRDALRQRQIVDLSSDWALLRRVSKKRLSEVLHQTGLDSKETEQYLWLWICFKQLYVPSLPTGKLPPPNSVLWDGIAQLYNAERLNQLGTAGTPLTAGAAERWLTQMARWVRSFLYPAVGSLNTPQFGEDTQELQDNLADLATDSLLNDLVSQEEATDRSQQQQQLGEVLSSALTQLDSQSQAILKLYYQQHLTQQQIMREMAMSQASVSRRLSKARESLLRAIGQWAQHLNISLTPDRIKEMSTVLDEWLVSRYQTV